MAHAPIVRRRTQDEQAMQAAQAATVPASFQRFQVDERGNIVDAGSRQLWTVVLDYEYDSYASETKEACFSSGADAR